MYRHVLAIRSHQPPNDLSITIFDFRDGLFLKDFSNASYYGDPKYREIHAAGRTENAQSRRTDNAKTTCYVTLHINNVFLVSTKFIFFFL